jgi:hypothetical protein
MWIQAGIFIAVVFSRIFIAVVSMGNKLQCTNYDEGMQSLLFPRMNCCNNLGVDTKKQLSSSKIEIN